ncbi:MAG: GAF domain-containing protein [Fimbriimonadaceae bacterium]|nr:GAF domain-containing protein [Fimbriimonadaceae bacterium]
MSINTMGTFESEDLKRQVEQLTQQLEALRQENSSLKSQSQGSTESTSAPEVRSTPAESGVEVGNIQEGDITLRRLVQRIAMILQAEKIVIMFYETETSELVAIPPAYGVDDEKLAHFRVRATQGITGEVFREAVPAIFHNAANDDRTKKDLVSLFHVNNGITVPLIIEKRDDENRIVDRTTIGVLHAFNKRHGEDFNDEDVRLLERMAKNVGSIIANLQLYKAVMKEREELLQTFESLTSGLVLITPEGKISQMNASARAVFRMEGEVIGEHYTKVTENPHLIEFLESGLAGGEPTPIEIEIDLKATLRDYSVQGAQVRNEDGKQLGFVTIIQDITEQKNLDKMKSSFVAMASHELRTPLTAIKGFSSTLLDGVDHNLYDANDQKEFLGIIVGECDRLRRLIDDLLNTARIESGQSLTPNYTQFELSNILEKVVRVQNQASARHEVKLEIHGDIPAKIIGDEDKFDQILTNLLNNAIKYSPEGGDVIVHAWCEGDDKIKIGVQDHGIGIPKEHLGKVFERFHRVNNEDNRKIYGTGLGLFLVRHLVEEVHLGEIWVESEVGKGSMFLFTMPKEIDIEKAKELNS